MRKLSVAQIEKKAQQIREDIISMLVEAGSGHSAGPLGMADIFATLYFSFLRHQPKNPLWNGRDRLVLSNGHICPVLYATLAEAGYFPKSELKTLRKFGSQLQGHPHRLSLPGVETTSGPLGSGLSQAAGMALVGKMKKASWRVYCMMSDAEFQEGNTWEGLMFAGKHKLSRLTAIIDRNHIQIDGFTEDIMPLEPLHKKLQAWNWNVLEMNGNSVPDIIKTLNLALTCGDKPTIIIAHTVPGRGVDFMENNFTWHGKPPTPQEATRALQEIKHMRTLGGKITPSHADNT